VTVAMQRLLPLYSTAAEVDLHHLDSGTNKQAAGSTLPQGWAAAVSISRRHSSGWIQVQHAALPLVRCEGKG
jgi:hypothetical protein